MAQIATNTVETVNSTSRHQKTFIIGSILRLRIRQLPFGKAPSPSPHRGQVQTIGTSSLQTDGPDSRHECTGPME
jgi:hypothetical protein